VVLIDDINATNVLVCFQSLFLITYQKGIDPCGYIQCMQVCQQVNILTN